jgi:hypothetical protein
MQQSNDEEWENVLEYKNEPHNLANDPQVSSFLDKHSILFSIVVGVVLAIFIRFKTKPSDQAEKEPFEDDSLADFIAKKKEPSFSGETNSYRWSQTEDEVEIIIPVAEDCRRQDIACQWKSKSVFLSVKGEPILDGAPFDAVDADESSWQFDRKDDAVTVVVSLKKKKRTSPTNHWRCVIHGHQNIDQQVDGPAVLSVDPSDPESIKRAVQQATEKH